MLEFFGPVADTSPMNMNSSTVKNILNDMIEQEVQLRKIANDKLGHYPKDVVSQAYALLGDSKSARENYNDFRNTKAEYRLDRVNWMSYTFLKTVTAFLAADGTFSEEAFQEVCDRA